jgi:hypothetical protein
MFMLTPSIRKLVPTCRMDGGEWQAVHFDKEVGLASWISSERTRKTQACTVGSRANS